MGRGAAGLHDDAGRPLGQRARSQLEPRDLAPFGFGLLGRPAQAVGRQGRHLPQDRPGAPGRRLRFESLHEN